MHKNRQVRGTVPACAPRRVYIDMGVNWCNTLRLYADLIQRPELLMGRSLPSSGWEVYGFEASPLIWGFADAFAAWLNGERAQKPESCLPPTGSSAHLEHYAVAYGCPVGSPELLPCLWEKLRGPLEALRPVPALNSTSLRHQRMASAYGLQTRGISAGRGTACVSRPPAGSARYVMIPAAVGDSARWMSLWSPPRTLIRGGALDLNGPVMRGSRAKHDAMHGLRAVSKNGTDAHSLFRVPVVNVVRWFKQAFTKEDFVILKADVEGNEVPILTAMATLGLMDRIDILSVEHPNDLWEALDRLAGRPVATGTLQMRRANQGVSAQLYREVSRWMGAPDMAICFESHLHHGIDSASRPPPCARSGCPCRR